MSLLLVAQYSLSLSCRRLVVSLDWGWTLLSLGAGRSSPLTDVILCLSCALACARVFPTPIAAAACRKRNRQCPLTRMPAQPRMQDFGSVSQVAGFLLVLLGALLGVAGIMVCFRADIIEGLFALEDEVEDAIPG